MQLKFRTYSAHPDYGTVQPDGIADVPERLAKEIIEGGYAQPLAVSVEPSAGERETAMLGNGETAMHAPAKRKSRRAV